jgi:hypothetical protein
LEEAAELTTPCREKPAREQAGDGRPAFSGHGENTGGKNPIRSTSVWPGARRGWGPITRNLDGEQEETT